MAFTPRSADPVRTYGIYQTVWAGIGYTFTSGADQAWLADEIGADHVAAVLVRTGLLLTPIPVLLARLSRRS